MLTLHFAPNSRAGRIVWLLEELELAYDINKMAFHPQDLKSDAHRARHPLGRVPVLDVQGQRNAVACLTNSNPQRLCGPISILRCRYWGTQRHYPR